MVHVFKQLILCHAPVITDLETLEFAIPKLPQDSFAMDIQDRRDLIDVIYPWNN